MGTSQKNAYQIVGYLLVLRK